MSTQMCLHIITFQKLSSTEFTFIWFLPRMYSNVFLQNTTPAKLRSTGGTFVRFLFCVCVRTCFLKSAFREKFAPQKSQLCGVSPVWMRLCTFKSLHWEKLAPQASHLYGFSPMWIRKCIFKTLYLTCLKNTVSEGLAWLPE